MPWVKGSEYTPAKYDVPRWLYCPTQEQIEWLKQHRRELGQLREFILETQKICGTRRDIESARWCRDEAAELLKQFRGYDMAIQWCESVGQLDTSEAIAPYIDQAFAFMDLH